VAIFTGKIANWSEVGGPKLPITVFVRLEDNTSTVTMREVLFHDVPFVKGVQAIDKSTDLQTLIEQIPGSIAYGVWTGMVAGGANVRPVALEGVAPTDPAYPITQPLFLRYRSEAQERVQPLVDWLRSEQGKAALRQYDVITNR
jgi:phosphate transport system substrate-binding protein